MRRSEAAKTATRLLGAIVVLGALYVGIAWWTSRQVPADMTVEGVSVGGLSVDQASERLTTQLGPVAAAPITITTPNSGPSFSIDPHTAGLTLDIPATLQGLGEFTLNPVTVWANLTGKTDRPAVKVIDRDALTAAVTEGAHSVNEAPVDGAIAVDTGAAKITPAQDGVDVVVSDTVSAIIQAWPRVPSVTAKTAAVAPKISQSAVDEAVRTFVAPALSGPLTLRLGEKTVALTPDRFGAAITLTPDSDKLVPTFDKDKLAALATEATSAFVTPAKDASIVLDGSAPVVRPSVDGVAVDVTPAPDLMISAMTATDRTVTLTTTVSKPKFTTEAAQALGVKEIVASFDSAFPTDVNRTINLTLASNTINGTLIKPGETFSMNGILGERTVAKGYREGNYIAGGGRLAKTVGGGVSQVSTVIYNIAWFAGVQLTEHHPHSFYISRYPAGREATVNWPTLDNKWTNNTPYGMLVQMWVSGGQVHGRMWSTKIYDVQSISGPRTNIRTGKVVTVTTPGCVPMGMADGFDITVTRVISQRGVVIKSEPYTTKYDAADTIICTAP